MCRLLLSACVVMDGPSFSFLLPRDGSFQRVEEKVYVYPTEDQLPLLPNLPPGVKEVAFMFSSDRGVVEQFDVAHEEPYPGWGPIQFFATTSNNIQPQHKSTFISLHNSVAGFQLPPRTSHCRWAE